MAAGVGTEQREHGIGLKKKRYGKQGKATRGELEGELY